MNSPIASATFSTRSAIFLLLEDAAHFEAERGRKAHTSRRFDQSKIVENARGRRRHESPLAFVSYRKAVVARQHCPPLRLRQLVRDCFSFGHGCSSGGGGSGRRAFARYAICASRISDCIAPQSLSASCLAASIIPSRSSAARSETGLHSSPLVRRFHAAMAALAESPQKGVAITSWKMLSPQPRNIRCAGQTAERQKAAQTGRGSHAMPSSS